MVQQQKRYLIGNKKSFLVQKKMVVRSSATTEDSTETSLAGYFSSIVGVQGEEEIVVPLKK